MGKGVEVSKRGDEAREAAGCLAFILTPTEEVVEAIRSGVSKLMSKRCRSAPTSTLERSGQVFH
jgi:hypothetical protein